MQGMLISLTDLGFLRCNDLRTLGAILRLYGASLVGPMGHDATAIIVPAELVEPLLLVICRDVAPIEVLAAKGAHAEAIAA